MNTKQAISMGKAQPGCHATTNITALSRKPRVAQVLRHQFVPHTGHPLDLHAPVLGVV